MLINKNTYKKTLSDLWHKVFGDDYSFINLIFKQEYKEHILCFAELDGDKAVSAFYLIRNELKFEGKHYDGYYLYAAATLPEYRKAGLMSKLIGEAQHYCREKMIDFISLVPSQESLYSYYERFGFQAAMYRSESRGCIFNNSLSKGEILTDAKAILEIRSRFEGNMINFHPATFVYAFDCLKNGGFEFIRISDDSYLLRSGDADSISEFTSSEKNLKENSEKLQNTDRVITSPFKLSAFSENKIKPYGMLYPVNNELDRRWKHTDIYMNLALD